MFAKAPYHGMHEIGTQRIKLIHVHRAVKCKGVVVVDPNDADLKLYCY